MHTDIMTASDALDVAPPHERYQFKPFTGSSHSWALAECRKLPVTSRVLDIGCGSGAIGRELKERGWTSLSAIDIDPKARENALAFYTAVEPSLDAYTGHQFDLILLLDVIEHMAEPEAFLRAASEHLAPGGTLLLSVPNIAHWSVRIPLLFGLFEYTARGLLDRTHLQLFTRRRVSRIPQLVSGLTLISQQGSIEPAEFVLPKFIWESHWFEALRVARRTIACLLPGMFAFQHLAVFKKN